MRETTDERDTTLRNRGRFKTTTMVPKIGDDNKYKNYLEWYCFPLHFPDSPVFLQRTKHDNAVETHTYCMY